MHLGPGVVQGRDAQKDIVVGGLVVDGLHPGRLHQGGVFEEDGLGEAGGAGGVVNRGLVLVVHQHLGGAAGAVGGGAEVVLGEGGAVAPPQRTAASAG